MPLSSLTANLVALTPLAVIPIVVIGIMGRELVGALGWGGHRAVRGARKRARSNRRIIASYGPGYGLLAWNEEWEWQEPLEE